MFEIGEQVLCISDKKQSHTIEELNNDVPNWIKKGQKYTIREIGICLQFFLPTKMKN